MNIDIHKVKIIVTIPPKNSEEERLEFSCDVDLVKKVLSKLREVHPYEEPAIDIVPLIDESYFK